MITTMSINDNKTKTICLIAFMHFFITLSASNIFNIEASTHLPRNGDKLERIMLEPFDLLDTSSENENFWDFSSLLLGEYCKPVCYRWAGDTTLFELENKETRLYRFYNDTLSLIGQRAPGKSIKYELPETLSIFPIGDTSDYHCHFYGEGTIDGNYYIMQSGISKTIAVARGSMITPDADSLRNVLLISYMRNGVTHISSDLSEAFAINNDSSALNFERINHNMLNDSISHGVETLRWYAQGLRYPVIELSRLITFYYGIPVDSVVVASYYPPINQKYDLTEDPINDSLFIADQNEPFIIPSWRDNTIFHLNQSFNGFTLNGNSCHVSPTLVSDFVTVTYEVNNREDIKISVYSTNGTMYLTNNIISVSGRGNFQLNLSTLPYGMYLISTRIGDDIFSHKIMKK